MWYWYTGHRKGKIVSSVAAAYVKSTLLTSFLSYINTLGLFKVNWKVFFSEDEVLIWPPITIIQSIFSQIKIMCKCVRVLCKRYVDMNNIYFMGVKYRDILLYDNRKTLILEYFKSTLLTYACDINHGKSSVNLWFILRHMMLYIFLVI